MKHCERVANLAYRLSDSLNLPNIITKNIYFSALIHDIGKSNLNQNILNKTGKLNEEERKHIEKHSYFSYLKALKLGYSQDIALNVLYHHEDYNGTGYPKRLRGNNIPLGARIIRICDVFDALTSNRVYRKALSIQEAMNIINDEREKFDPNICCKFIKIYKGEKII